MQVRAFRKKLLAAVLLLSALLLALIFSVRGERGRFSSFLTQEAALDALMSGRQEDPSLIPADLSF